MAFSDIVGQTKAKAILHAALTHDRLAHAYLFFGPAGVGKEFTALELAKALNCQTQEDDACDQCVTCRKIRTFNHPDVKLVFPTPSDFSVADMNAFLQEKAADPTLDYHVDKPMSLSIDTVRALQKEAAYKPYEARKKCYILLEVDRMTVPAANAFLKTLEEPPSHTQFILTTSNIRGLLDTIVSRCQAVQFTPLSAEEIEHALIASHQFDPAEARLAARLANGSLGEALKAQDHQLVETRNQALQIMDAAFSNQAIEFLTYIEKMGKTRNRNLIIQLLDVLQLWYRDLMMMKEFDDADRVANLDQLDRIHRESDRLSMNAVMASIQIIETIKADIRQNVNVQLALTVLLLRLRKARLLS
ncbi:MAG: DNA polymerase III subunit delta' [Gemmatimonadetes bacterium]|nr:MAG: DNA polymerase III subunit delta' [Gemmatimonadota bacterium]